MQDNDSWVPPMDYAMLRERERKALDMAFEMMLNRSCFRFSMISRGRTVLAVK